jgi:hypothetical protein
MKKRNGLRALERALRCVNHAVRITYYVFLMFSSMV